MSRIIRAKVLTNSSDDKYSRVKIQTEGLWEESELVESVNMIPLSKGDIVFVDVTAGFESPLILGKAANKDYKPAESVEGEILYQSSNGSDYTIAFVKNDNLEIHNSSGVKISVNKGNVTISGASVSIEKGSITIDGTVSPTGKGALCAIPVCPFTGANHTGPKATV